MHFKNLLHALDPIPYLRTRVNPQSPIAYGSEGAKSFLGAVLQPALVPVRIVSATPVAAASSADLTRRDSMSFRSWAPGRR